MMILRSAPPSPFGRKIRIAADILGLTGKIDVQATDTNNASDTVRQQNPLGKIPVLITEKGKSIYDSRVILDYLDQQAGGGKIIPRDPDARLDAMLLQALCDGILDACILLVYEGRFRPAEKHEAKWLDYQAEKVARGLAVLESSPPKIDAMPNVGQITLACLLGYRDLRFQGTWRKGHPKLVAWLDAFAAKVPAFEATRFNG